MCPPLDHGVCGTGRLRGLSGLEAFRAAREQRPPLAPGIADLRAAGARSTPVPDGVGLHAELWTGLRAGGQSERRRTPPDNCAAGAAPRGEIHEQNGVWGGKRGARRDETMRQGELAEVAGSA